VDLKRNVLANYASQIYITVIGIIQVPLYLKYMGAEAYGLVGFFTLLQVWFNLLDMGLASTMMRETARFQGGAADALNYRRLVRALQVIFLAVALIGGSAIFASAGFIASDWLKVQALPLSEVQFAVQIMALGVALRWMCGLYRGVISGFERFVWLAGYNSLIATLRFVGVLLVLIFVGTTPTVFFTYQLLMAVVDLVGLAVKMYGLLPAVPAGQRLGWSFTPIKPVLNFSLTIAFTSSLSILVGQTDQLVLSRLLPLAEYGYFTLAVLVANAVMITTSPISSALIPRLTRLEGEGNHAGLIKLYRGTTQLVCVIALPVAFTLAAFAEPVVWAWTGDPIAAKFAAPILQLYVVGNGVLAVAAFAYYLQYAKGDLRLHLLGNTIFVVLLIPLLVWATWRFGGVGAGWAWLGASLMYFFGWIPLVHRRFVPGLHRRWMFDVLPIAAGAAIGAWAVSMLTPAQDNRLQAIVLAMLMGMLVLMITASSSPIIRTRAWLLMHRV
jgi:O-antigen/teichoic acid export membrane protein